MSSSLYWEPVQREEEWLPDELKYVLQKRVGGTVDTVMSERDIPYLEGLRDAGVSGADALIEAIKKHDRVSVHEKF
jgi:hypothetical protein